eukprot:1156924-Pelagomonas_calceolata.AAC.15
MSPFYKQVLPAKTHDCLTALKKMLLVPGAPLRASEMHMPKNMLGLVLSCAHCRTCILHGAPCWAAFCMVHPAGQQTSC